MLDRVTLRRGCAAFGMLSLVSLATVARADPTTQPSPAQDPHAGLNLGMADVPEVVLGSPFASATHVMQASLARRGQRFQPESGAEANMAVPRGTIVALVTDARQAPLASRKVQLKAVRQSVAEGDKPFEIETTTDAQGRAAFQNQNTDSIYRYEVVVQEEDATYSSGLFRLELDKGMIAVIRVFPVTPRFEETFLLSRALYVIEPRHDVFRIEVLCRFHNAGPLSWRARAYPMALPHDAKAFSPGASAGDVRLIESGGQLLLTGTFAPGQHELTFSYQLPNPGEPSATLQVPIPPNLVDARVFLEASKEMGLSVSGFESSTRVQGNSGQPALLVQQDFLKLSVPSPQDLRVTVTGLPSRGLATGLVLNLAIAIAAGGIALPWVSRRRKSKQGNAGQGLAQEDLQQAQERLLDELVALENARARDEIGPRTYDQARRVLLDALVRLEVAEAD